MNVAVVYSVRDGQTINRFGMRNHEYYPAPTVDLVIEALRRGGHVVEPFVADCGLLARLADWLPKQTGGEITGMVFNLALGLQGKCRYTHIPAMLEMTGIPYTGSSPLGHALALDKLVAKQIFLAAGIATPRFAVFDSPGPLTHDLRYPLVVKPRSEAASFGLSVVDDHHSLRKAVETVVETFQQSALVEEFIAGREVNISLIGNDPPSVLPILELEVSGGTNVLSHDLKFDHTGNRVKKICPAQLDAALRERLRGIAVRAYGALNVYDHARVDIRIDEFGDPWVLELNSMASINPASSLVHAARAAGLEYDALINEILESACARYRREAARLSAAGGRSRDEAEGLLQR